MATRMHDNGMDWRTMAEGSEKYQAYLCSREWAVKKEAVRDRAHGVCERCNALPMDHCHHTTYARKYNEPLEDLQALCKPCHDFTHGKSEHDPKESHAVLAWLRHLKTHGMQPMPMDLMTDVIGVESLSSDVADLVRGIGVLEAAGLDLSADRLRGSLPFHYTSRITQSGLWLARCNHTALKYWYEYFGFPTKCRKEWLSEDEISVDELNEIINEKRAQQNIRRGGA